MTDKTVRAMPELPEPAILMQPEGGELVMNKDGDEPHFWAWGAHGYDTGMWPYFSDDQMHAYALTYAESLRVQLEAARAALKFYADKEHFDILDTDVWDTVSGEPQNYWYDEASTAVVEDGAIARAALSNHTQGEQSK